MYESNFLKIFKTFDKKEAISFEKYLLLIFPGEKVAFSVFKYIRKYHPEFQDPALFETKYAYKIIFPADADVNPKKISNALSQLSGWAKEFLLIEKIKSDSIERELLLGGILKMRNLQWDFLRSTDKLEQLLATMSKSCVEDYINYMRGSYQFFYQKESNGINETVKNLNEVVQAADITYALSKIKMACEMEASRHFKSVEISIHDMDLVLQLADRYKYDCPLLHLYYDVYQLAFHQQNEYFNSAVDLLGKYAQKVSNSEMHDILTHLRNYLGKRFNNGDEAIREKGQALNEISLSYGFFQREKMTGVAFSNIINIACSVHKIEWAQQFISEIGPNLPAAIRDDTVIISKAHICEAQKNYSAILGLLEKHHFRDIKLNIIARSFILKTNCNLRKEPAFILDQCNAFTSYLNRQTSINKSALEPALNFIKMVKLLNNKPKSKNAYLKELGKHSPVHFYKWLKEMCPAR